MRISKEDKLGGLPLVQIRDFLRKVDGSFDSESARKKFGKKTKSLIATLSKQGFISKTKKSPGDLWSAGWETTIKGNALADATAAPPISRKRADQIVKELLERVREVQRNSQFFYKVRRLIVFGSYVKGAETLSDVDFILELGPKISNDTENYVELLLDKAKKSGRRFPNYLSRLHWAHNEVWLYLRNRKGAISFHHSGHLKMLKPKDYQILHVDETIDSSFVPGW